MSFDLPNPRRPRTHRECSKCGEPLRQNGHCWKCPSKRVLAKRLCARCGGRCIGGYCIMPAMGGQQGIPGIFCNACFAWLKSWDLFGYLKALGGVPPVMLPSWPREYEPEHSLAGVSNA